MDDSTGATRAPEGVGSVNINTAFPSKYVKAAEIPEEGLVAAIDRVDMEDVDGKGSMKPVLYFRGGKKGLVLNVTNSKKIVQLVGSDNTDNWSGQKITLYQSETEYAGDTVACIRVRAAKGVTPTAPAPAPTELGSPTLDVSEIPF
jgi:hypothetical protein